MLSPQDISIAKHRAAGLTLQEIAKQPNVTIAASNVSRHISGNPELHQLIIDLQQRAIEQAAEPAVNNIIHLVQSYQGNKCETEQERIEKSHGYKASARIAESIGILPASAPSIIYNKITQVRADITISNELAVLQGFLSSQWEDAELIEDASQDTQKQGENYLPVDNLKQAVSSP